LASINEYRYRISLYKKVLSPNTWGGYSTTLTLIDTIWAGMTPLQGKELMQYKQLYPTATTIFKIRYRPDITTNIVIKYGSTKYNIVSYIDVNNLHDEIIIYAEVNNSEKK